MIIRSALARGEQNPVMPMIPPPRCSCHTSRPRPAVLIHRHAVPVASDSKTPRGEEAPTAERDGVVNLPLILIADDDRDVRKTLAALLEYEGLECREAHDGAEALELLRRMERRPDLILLDLMMPVMNGRDFRAAQLADPQLATIPTLILTAATDAASQAKDLTAAGCLRKPINLDALLSDIERLIPGWQPDE